MGSQLRAPQNPLYHIAVMVEGFEGSSIELHDAERREPPGRTGGERSCEARGLCERKFSPYFQHPNWSDNLNIIAWIIWIEAENKNMNYHLVFCGKRCHCTGPMSPDFSPPLASEWYSFYYLKKKTLLKVQQCLSTFGHWSMDGKYPWTGNVQEGIVW